MVSLEFMRGPCKRTQTPDGVKITDHHFAGSDNGEMCIAIPTTTMKLYQDGVGQDRCSSPNATRKTAVFDLRKKAVQLLNFGPDYFHSCNDTALAHARS